MHSYIFVLFQRFRTNLLNLIFSSLPLLMHNICMFTHVLSQTLIHTHAHMYTQYTHTCVHLRFYIFLHLFLISQMGTSPQGEVFNSGIEGLYPEWGRKCAKGCEFIFIIFLSAFVQKNSFTLILLITYSFIKKKK